jgi:mannosyl-oligosaccharide alpha-1,2-mannosidase
LPDLKSAKGIINNLIYLTPNRNLLYVTDMADGYPSHIFEHLSCFLPGLFALASHTLDLPPRDKQLHEWAAKGLAYTCWIMYADQATGLGPDEVQMQVWYGGDAKAGRWVDHVDDWETEGGGADSPPGLDEVPPEQEPESRDYSPRKPGYLLRPEVSLSYALHDRELTAIAQTVESFYILWRTTGDVKWRERGWSVFEAIEKETRTQYGYASIYDVDRSPPSFKDEMPRQVHPPLPMRCMLLNKPSSFSYFLAET